MGVCGGCWVSFVVLIHVVICAVVLFANIEINNKQNPNNKTIEVTQQRTTYDYKQQSPHKQHNDISTQVKQQPPTSNVSDKKRHKDISDKTLKKPKVFSLDTFLNIFGGMGWVFVSFENT